jgi:ABC-type transporter Mla subunit MlaD
MIGEAFMKLRLVAVITALVALPVLAHAQQGGPPSNAPKPTKADAQKVVQIITSDKAKTQTYCDLDKLFDQMQTADQKNDSKTVETLGKQADVLAAKLGPEYNKMMDGMDQVDSNSNEGKELVSVLSGLDKLCSK